MSVVPSAMRTRVVGRGWRRRRQRLEAVWADGAEEPVVAGEEKAVAYDCVVEGDAPREAERPLDGVDRRKDERRLPDARLHRRPVSEGSGL